jgi:hypothetical protein
MAGKGKRERERRKREKKRERIAAANLLELVKVFHFIGNLSSSSPHRQLDIDLILLIT